MKTPSFLQYEEWCALVDAWEAQVKRLRILRNRVGAGLARASHFRGLGPTQQDLEGLQTAEAALSDLALRIQALLQRAVVA